MTTLLSTRRFRFQAGRWLCLSTTRTIFTQPSGMKAPCMRMCAAMTRLPQEQCCVGAEAARFPSLDFQKELEIRKLTILCWTSRRVAGAESATVDLIQPTFPGSTCRGQSLLLTFPMTPTLQCVPILVSFALFSGLTCMRFILPAVVATCIHHSHCHALTLSNVTLTSLLARLSTTATM